jgi:hypothetical protein
VYLPGRKAESSPFGELWHMTLFHQGDVYGRISFDGNATVKPVCDWSLGLGGG